jgi:hypothetical protein
MNLLTNSADVTSGRKYRSKKQRPCDFCRSRKSQCRILSGSTACELCKRLDRTCTFVLQPLRRERHQAVPGPDTSANQSNLPDDADEIQPGLMPAMNTNNNISDSAWWPSPLTNGTLPYDLNSLSQTMPVDWSSMDFALGVSFVASRKHRELRMLTMCQVQMSVMMVLMMNLKDTVLTFLSPTQVLLLRLW